MKTCPNGGKICYPSEASAKRHRRPTMDKRMSVYRCPNCREWHLTSHRN